MISAIVKKEILSNLLGYKFYVVILLTAVLTATSFFVMARDYKERSADYSLIRPKPGEPIAVNPPNPLSIFAKGMDEAMARSFEVSVIGIHVRSGQKSGNAVFSFYPAPDFLYVVRVILSLVALLFGFDQVNREKETGTLRLMLANPAPRAGILAGKWLGNFLTLSVPFLLVTMLGAAVLNLDPAIRLSADQILRLGLILVLTLFYIGFFLSLGLLVSTLTRRASSSLVILLFVWTLFVFILPNLGTLIARQAIEVPSVRALSEKRRQIWTREILLLTRGEGDRASHIKAISAENDAIEADYRIKFDRMVGLAKTINRISPVAGFVYAVTDIAGTGIGEEGALKREVVRYKNSVIDGMLGPPKEGSGEAPAFRYVYRPLNLVLARGALFDAAWLIVFNILFFALSHTAFVRYDVR